MFNKVIKKSQLPPVLSCQIFTGCFITEKCICFACWVQTSYSNITVDTLSIVESQLTVYCQVELVTIFKKYH